jgi:hypothetical protein
MGKLRPLCWIEEAEARQVLTLALSEASPLRSADDRPRTWVLRIRRWVGAAAPAGEAAAAAALRLGVEERIC